MNKINIASLRKSLRLRQKDFGEKIGIKQAYLSEIESGKKPLTEELYNNIIEVFGMDKVSEHFISTNNSDIIANKNTNEAVPLNQNYIINVPLVNQYAQAGYICGFQDAAYIATLPTIPFIIDHEAKGNYVAFEVRGDSMNDGTEESYLEGDRLLCREIAPYLWAESKLHIRKWDFVIVHEGGILVKRIIDHNVENHTITIHSLNDMYPDRVIDLAEVKQIFNVIELQRPRRR
ncbi:helix-turn-helix domain-containing protein [Bacteroides fragilis]|uniref:XRE family transcriptional regulator n=1 Tax=Bacteroides fragilis TaxID=817 RepID=UPI00202E8EA9|nr:LexA family transcriptional regulator [Bacteroides fragilis]MCM0342676.1 helix-turn-helix domain-containing protein [Bacteroides fragilis]